jgi:hypothetical protein
MRLFLSTGILVACLGLSACGMGLSASPSDAPDKSSSFTEGIRVMVRLQTTSIPKDKLSFLQEVKHATGARSVSFVSELISGGYVLVIVPVLGQTEQELLRRLSELRDVSAVEMDKKVKPH